MNKSDTGFAITSSNNRCPNCGEDDLTKHLDGSGYCKNCGKTFRSSEGSMKQEKQEFKWEGR